MEADGQLNVLSVPSGINQRPGEIEGQDALTRTLNFDSGMSDAFLTSDGYNTLKLIQNGGR